MTALLSPALIFDLFLVNEGTDISAFFIFFIKRRQLTAAHMGVCDHRNMDPRTACLRCLHAGSLKAPFDPERTCDRCKRHLGVSRKIVRKLQELGEVAVAAKAMLLLPLNKV